MNESLVGTVHLKVQDLEKQVRFYESAVGLKKLREDGNTVFMGAGSTELVGLKEVPGAQPVRGTTGLYHFALLVPSRFELARVLKHIADAQIPIQGLSEHHVSEAIYLPDAEGNGIEIYRDRPRVEWFVDGQFRMVTEPMDVEGIMDTLSGQEIPDWDGLPDGTVMGHVHLHVASVPGAETFYRDLLGMDVMINIPSATFMSYEGYHHHLGANTWSGSTPPPDNATGLDFFELTLPDESSLDDIAQRLESAGHAVERESGFLWATDPSQNRFRLAGA